MAGYASPLWLKPLQLKISTAAYSSESLQQQWLVSAAAGSRKKAEFCHCKMGTKYRQK